jgi:aspartate aminotransferase
MAARAKQMKASGIDVISMSLGEPDFDTPEHIRRAAQEAIDNHWSHYGPVPGIPSLRAAAAAQQNSVPGNAIEWQAEDVLVSVGAKMAIFNAIQAAVNPGDEVIIPMPSWVSYTEMVKLAEGKVVSVETTYEDDYCLTPAQLRAVITPRTRMIILCSPNNPTGAIYSQENIQALIAVLRDYPEVIILSDEIYASLTYDAAPSSLAAYPELADRLIIINGVSKAYAMTGYRVGWMMTKDKKFLAGCTRLQGQQLTCATMVAQKAAEVALTAPQDSVNAMRDIFAERRELICRLAAEIPGLKFRRPKGAFYLFPDVTDITSNNTEVPTADALAEYLLDQAHVAVVSGPAFGCPSCIRLSYAISTEEIVEAMKRIKQALENLKK